MEEKARDSHNIKPTSTRRIGKDYNSLQNEMYADLWDKNIALMLSPELFPAVSPIVGKMSAYCGTWLEIIGTSYISRQKDPEKEFIFRIKEEFILGVSRMREDKFGQSESNTFGKV